MKRAKEIQSAINNIGYYANKINELAKAELEDENLIDANVNILGSIGESADSINTECQYINNRLKEAK